MGCTRNIWSHGIKSSARWSACSTCWSQSGTGFTWDQGRKVKVDAKTERYNKNLTLIAQVTRNSNQLKKEKKEKKGNANGRKAWNTTHNNNTFDHSALSLVCFLPPKVSFTDGFCNQSLTFLLYSASQFCCPIYNRESSSCTFWKSFSNSLLKHCQCLI